MQSSDRIFMTETYLLINQIHATLPAPARQTLHAWEATPCWLWHCQGRAVALLVGRWDVPGKGGVHPPVSECASLGFPWSRHPRCAQCRLLNISAVAMLMQLPLLAFPNMQGNPSIALEK